ncbi:PAS domain-containing protein [Pigmentiphaga aceris]|uniref:histidine kinase n=1 Tax=Pigmentiphaga aceris TaxID=1940612 RepID=A0A5C0AVG5_9BURK|nr:ATP-binding protein [Pigmentiphaga aceris]QEI05343.1 PAS domain-containing protein [Pigmentiphaga aceris]
MRPAYYVARIDTRHTIVQFDERYEIRRRLGLPADGALSVETAVGASAYALLLPFIERGLAGEQGEFELDLPDSTGVVHRVRGNYVPERDASGAVTGLTAVISDVGAQRHTEQLMVQQQRDIAALVENSPDIIARLDLSSRFLYVNHAVELAFGVQADQVIGRTTAEAGFPADVAASFEAGLREAIESRTEHRLNLQMSQGGKLRHYSSRLIPQFDGDVLSSVLAITYDVTQRVEAELERDALLVREKVARMQAEAAARARDQFLAVVSHELRSPLNGIQSWTHVLESYLDAESPPVRRALAGIKTGVQQQVRLIEDLLDATQLTAGKMQLVKQPIRLQPVLQSAVSRVAAAAEARHVTIELDAGQNDGHVIGDAERLEQVVWNLLSNAVKFSTEHASVHVTLSNEGGDAIITVRDTGRGIAPEFLPYLFVPFRQADGSRTRRAGGIGLGLMLVRRLTEMHGGRVVAFSAGEDKGATFSVYLPLEWKKQVEGSFGESIRSDGEQAMVSLEGVSVLLVDDQAEARDALQVLLEQAGATVVALDSGVTAVAYLRDIDTAARPNVLVCDIAMPLQDGYLTLQQIRAHEKEHPGLSRLPAIALTAFTQREDKIRVLSSGFQVHLAKPADAGELIAIIDMLARHGADTLFAVEG